MNATNRWLCKLWDENSMHECQCGVIFMRLLRRSFIEEMENNIWQGAILICWTLATLCNALPWCHIVNTSKKSVWNAGVLRVQFLEVMSCNLVDRHQYFGGCLHLQDRHCWDGFRCHGIHTNFHKDLIRHSKVYRGRGYTDTQHGDFISLLLFFSKGGKWANN
jgi:hypothetical protein